MPESKSRKQADAKKKSARKDQERETRAASKRLAPGASWVAPTFVTLLLVGVLWMVVWYITSVTGIRVPLMTDLGNWNMGIGMGLMAASFAVATQWK